MIELLVAKVLAAHPRVGLELQWELTGDDDDPQWTLELHVIVELPGPDHSRYSTIGLHQFPGEQIEQRREARRIATAVAERTQLWLHVPDIERHGGHGGSGWIRTQPKGEPVAFEATWEASWWTAYGDQDEARGTEVVHAISGEEARYTLLRELDRRFADRPLTTRASVVGASSWGTTKGRNDGIELDRLRAAAREIMRASHVARVLADYSPIAVMCAFDEAFRIHNVERLVPIARWRRGALDDAALDAAITPLIEQRQWEWDRPRRLREAQRDGRLREVVRAEYRAVGGSRLHVIRDLREATTLSLSEAESFLAEALR